jgi:cytochrome c553
VKQAARSAGISHGALLAVALLFGAATPAAAQTAGDAAAGREKARACAVCHGPLGLSTAPDAPNLAAQPAIYLAAQLRAYRSGARQHEVMSVMSKTLTDADIDNLAAWYASLQVEVKPPL